MAGQDPSRRTEDLLPFKLRLVVHREPNEVAFSLCARAGAAVIALRG
jgi:hypothetical protein